MRSGNTRIETLLQFLVLTALPLAFGAGACGSSPDSEALSQGTVETQAADEAPLCAVNPDGVSKIDCDGDAANGCEIDPYDDDRNCGACGNACGEGFACIQKRCCNPATRECE